MKSGYAAVFFPGKSLRQRTAILFSAVLLSSQMLPASLAAPLSIPAASTTLDSDSDRMISYRHQEHMWQTADGATHVVINRGTLAQPGASLVLYSSFDSGKSWIEMLALGNSGIYSTADGVLVGNDLSLTYPSLTGKILFAVVHYDDVLKNWSPVRTETVFASSGIRGINPALAIDSQGTIWCAFVNVDNASNAANIRLVQQAPGVPGWQDTGLIFGPTDNTSIERSARPVVLSDGVGMVYTVHENIFWAYRLNGWPATAPWIEQTLFTSAPPYDDDPYASHFSVVADDQKNLHMATVDHGQVLYFRFDNQTQAWNPSRFLTKDINAGYLQVSMALGNLAIFFNTYNYVKVLQSTDFGATFSFTHFLTHELPPPGGTISYALPRIETPGLSLGPIPVFQQYTDDAIQKVMYFEVPAITPGATQ
jgi:hypothetical protein